MFFLFFVVGVEVSLLRAMESRVIGFFVLCLGCFEGYFEVFFPGLLVSFKGFLGVFFFCASPRGFIVSRLGFYRALSW